MNSNISNCSSEKLRRVDLAFNVAGSEPVQKVRSTIMKVVVDTDKAMADPAPQVEPLAGIPGGLTYTVRVWCTTADYWDVYFELMREIPTALGAAGIAGPSTPVKVG
jgi:small conductance mechanosensitive channel